MMKIIKVYFVNWGLTLAMIFWFTVLWIRILLYGLFSAVVKNDKFWFWIAGTMITIGVKALELISKLKKKENNNVDRAA